ncbi:hypothetical protein GCM10009760_53630 [Kitasatospora kazusensis]|uniref:Uncharacterized protein n=1 Tax=Kitasatospora kazusensis TaxID=407974 RepID=A0ABN3A6F4_9ACTN
MTDFPVPPVIEGISGELIERLIMALRSNIKDQSTSPPTAIVSVAITLGLPISNEWNAEVFLRGVQRKLLILRDMNVMESFLAISVRDSVSRWVRSQTSFEAANKNREEDRARLQRVLDDDVAFEEFKSMASAQERDGVSRTDAQIRADLEKVMNGLLAPVSSDEVTRSWADEERWRNACGAYLADDDIEEWYRRYIAGLAR